MEKQIGLVGLLSSVGSAIFILALGFFGKSTFTPIIIDKVFGVTDYVSAKIRNSIDSGYSGSYAFSKENPKPAVLLFYAKKGQQVTISFNNTFRGQETPLNFFVDNKPWDPGGVHTTHSDITEHLVFDRAPGGDIHTLRIAPAGEFSSGAVAVSECLVLVYAAKEGRND